jgi:carbamoyl-phosphate synthase large subunit
MNPQLTVLVTGAGSLLGQGILRALRASSLRLRIIAVDPNALSAGLYWADAAHLIPTATEPGYLPSIGAIFAQEKPDAVLIGTDVELGVFAEHRERIEREFSTHVIVSDPQVVAIADDKWKSYEFFKANGFDCPESCLPGDEDELIAKVDFPLIVKPRVGARSVGVELVRDRQELSRATSAGRRVIIQECVGTPDDEYTAGAQCLRRLQGPVALSGRGARHRYAKHDRPASHQGVNRSASIGESMRWRRPHPGEPS